MTITYVSDPVHADVLAELRELGQVHLGYGPDRRRLPAGAATPSTR